MKKAVFSLLFTLTLSFLQAQNVNLAWVKKIGGPFDDTAISIAIDGSGNVYTTGTFRNTVDFDPGAGVFNLTSAGSSDIFVSKFDGSGNFIWATRIGNAGADFVEQLSVDAAGNVYYTGDFAGTVDFDPGASVSNLAAIGGLDIFISKLDANGNFVFAKRIGGSGNDYGETVLVEASTGNIVVSGIFNNTVDFDPGAGVFNLVSAGNFEIYVLKLDASANFIWARRMGGTLNDAAYDMALDPLGNIYTTGQFGGTADFDPGAGAFTLTAASNEDIFISKLDASGNFVWAKQIGGSLIDLGSGIAIDVSGNVLTTGYFRNTADFDPGAGSFPLTATGAADAFISKLDANGNFLWVKQMGGTGGTFGSNIGTDLAGNIFTSGNFNQTSDFNPGVETFRFTALGSLDLYVSKLDASGNFSWAQQMGKAGDNYARGMYVDGTGIIYTTGFFNGTTDFDPGNCELLLTTSGAFDSFIQKLVPSTLATCVPTINSFAPSGGPIGTTVIINGTYFSTIAGNNTVYFGAEKATVTAATSTQLTVTVPMGATYQPISVTVSGLTAYSNGTFIVSFPEGGIIDACSFSVPTVYGSAGGAGVDLAMGDLDGDGKTDIAETNYANNTLQLFRNTSTTGTIDANSFAPSVDFVVGNNPYGVAIADIDGDGKLDVVVTSGTSNILSIFRNISTIGALTAASFATRVDFATGSQPFHLNCTDLDGDGKTDIAVGNQASGSISIWQNIGLVGSITTGSFAPRLDIAGPSSGFTIADVDVDGRPDLIGGYNLGSAIGVSRNISSPGPLTTGSFSPFVNFTTSAWPENIVVGDLDSDNKPDILSSSWPGNVISILKNTSTPGTITTGSFAANLDITGNGEPRGVVITDFDGDGVPDIGLSNQTGTLSIYKNANTPGSITSASFLPKVNFPGIGNARSVLSGDFDGDGKPDVTVANFGSPSLLVLRNTVSSLPPPTITGFGPTTGNVGGTVSITGTNFSTTLLNNTVKFNGVPGTVTAATSTNLTVTIPVGATTGTISVTLGCNTATSSGILQVSCVPITERNALIALYISTNGSGWTDNSNWLSPDENTWAGVLVTDCHVSDLIFLGNNLIGPLPPEIGDLTYVTRMEMPGNHLNGSLPSQIGNMVRLDLLNLLNNQISGSIPLQIGNLTALTHLELSFNQLTGNIPAQIGGLTNLVALGLSKNQLSGSLPSEFWNLTQLKSVGMFQNQLNGSLPPEIGNLVNLTTFNLEGNGFINDIPPEIGNLIQLKHLILSYNQFSGLIPFEIGNLVLLKELQLSNNFLSGAVPIEIGNLGVCDVLTLDHNQLDDLPNLTTTPIYILNQNFADLTVNDNYLTFEDLEPNKPFPLITLGPQAKIPPGGVISFSVGGTLTIPFTTPGTANLYQWYKDNIPIPAATASTLVRPGMTASDVGYYTVRITNTIATGITLESYTYTVVTDQCPPGPRTSGDLDTGFNPLITTPSTFNGVGIQSTGKVIASTYSTEISSVFYSGVLRFNDDGSLDNTFPSNAYGPRVLVQPDDRIIASYSNGTYAYVVRMNADGTDDAAFNANAPQHYNGNIRAMALQPEGKIVTAVQDYMTPTYLERLNLDGTLDATFAPDPSLGLGVEVVKVQQDGYILLGGDFPGGIRRIDQFGAVDPGFSTLGSDNYVTDIALQSDGKIIVTGLFENFDDQPRRGIIRLNPNGSVDFSFNASGITDTDLTTYYAYKIAVQYDDKIVLAGQFNSVNGTSRKNLIVLNEDGSVDCSFDPQTSTDDLIENMTIREDGKIVVIGSFTTYEGTTRYGLARVNNVLSSGIPTITNFTPLSGTVGATITVTGTNFSFTPANNTVFFGATKATVSASTSTQFTTTVPIGATFEPISAMVGGLTAYAPKPFIPTFPGGGSIIASSFGTHVDFAAPANAISINIGDLDLDGFADMVVSSQNVLIGNISVYRNTSTPGTITSGSFAPPVNLTATADRSGMSIADIDGDGKPEIIAVNVGVNRVTIYRNISTPGTLNASSFAAPIQFNVGVLDAPTNVDIEDLDGDGLPEIVTADYAQDRITIIKNTSSPGSISFQIRKYFPAGGGANDISIRDLNKDGKPDLIIANELANTVSVLQNVTTPGVIDLTSFLPAVNFAVGSGPTKIAIGDIDGDGNQDLITANLGSNNISILKNQISAGPINAGSFAASVNIATAGPTNSVELGDLNGDGKIDIATAINTGATGVAVLQNTSTPGSISFSPFVGFNAGTGTFEVAIGDLDGDGRPEIATANNGAPSVSVLQNTSTLSCLPATERNALIALYTATNGASWTNKTNWLGADESTWFGVTVAGCHITELDLDNNNLVGTLPIQIGDLLQLTSLKLSFNHLNGGIPSSLTNLTALQYLWLDNNVTLSGPLPAAIGNMVALKEIVTQSNAFTGLIPPSMSTCVALEKIHLEGNQHTGSLPAYFSTFPNLNSINLGFNQFTGTIPTSWGSITNLSFLSLAENDLTGNIPIEFGALDNLLLMDLSRNRLSGTIPIELGNMSLIGSLQLWDNQLTGNIPSQLGNATTLQYLSLAQNQLSGSIPISMGNLTDLLYLELNNNQLTGSIPVALGNDVLLQFLRLSVNQLTGSIPSAFGNLTQLFLLDLNQNQLTGSIPTSLGNDVLLKFLNLYTNQLSGSIPVELGNLTVLEDFTLFSNLITGSLPKELGQCVKLRSFEVADNQLSGTLPKEYGSWPNIEILQINNNQITGAVPVEYLTWTKIIKLYFSNNQLDAIPTFTAPTITELKVENNLFEFGDLEPNMPVAGYTYNPQGVLPGGNISLNVGNPLSIPFVTSGSANLYQWYKNAILIPGATSSTFSIPSATLADAGNYTVNVTNTIVTGLTITTLPFVVTVIPVINITSQPIDFTACDGDLATFTTAASGTTNITYQWQFSPPGPLIFADISNGPKYAGATAATLSVNTTGNFGAGRYRCRINGDLATQVITFDEGLTINPLPPAPGTSGNTACATSTVTLSANGGVNGQYRWYTVASGGTAIVGAINNTFVTPALTTTTNYFVTIKIGSCESTRTLVTATINPLPAVPAVTQGSSCAPSAAVLLSASGGVNGQYRWYTVATGGAPIAAAVNGTYTTPLLTVSTTYYVSINNGTCESTRTPVLAEIKSCTPVITATALSTTTGGQAGVNLIPLIATINNALDISSISIVVPPSSGAVATITAGSLMVDYSGIAFAGTDQLTIRACDVAAHCAQQVITIDVTGEITVFNAVSPNGDGKNEVFFIQSINLLPETRHNKVSIFNRWGDVVFDVENYDNTTKVFRGQDNSGGDLPAGTYYYKIDFPDGPKTKTGFISLKR